MLTLVNRLAIRNRLSAQYPPAVPKAYFGAAMRMMRAKYLHSRIYEDSFRIFRRNQRLFSLDDLESQFLGNIFDQRYALAPSFFSKELLDRIYAKADAIFHRLRGDETDLFSSSSEGRFVEQGRRDKCASYGQTIEMIDPLVNIPEVLDIAFHESILKIAAHFFQHIPRVFKVSVVRNFPDHRPKCLAGVREGNERRASVDFIIDLADIDDIRGPFVYVPGSQKCLTLDQRRRGASDNPTPQQPYVTCQEGILRRKWVVLRAERGSIIALPGNGNRGAIWTYPSDINNKPRTSILVHVCEYKRGDAPVLRQNLLLRWNFDRMTEMQRMFVYAGLVDEPLPSLAKAG